MGIIRTLGRVLTGFIVACLAAGLIQVLFVATPKELAALPVSAFQDQARTAFELSLLTATHFALFSAAFALIAAGIAEWLGVTALGYWLAAGTGIAILGFIAQYSSEVAGQPSIFNNYALQAYLTAGFFGGLVYWLVAGMHSGATHRDGPLPAPAEAAPTPRIIVEKTERGGVAKGSLAERLSLKRSKTEASPAASAPSGPQPPPSGDAETGKAKVSATAKTPPSPAPATAVPVTRADASKQTATAKPEAPKDAPGK